MQPIVRCLDLFCCAGGAAMGLHRAGFDVTGVDINPQPRYPFQFIQGDALAQDLTGFDFVWASPPCQHYSGMSGCRDGLRETYPDLIGPVRAKLEAWGGPWIIENVMGAPLRNPVVLCGSMFALKTYRHRQFESNLPLTAPPHPAHTTPTSKAGHWRPGTLVSVAGNCAPVALAREAMGIDWTNRRELAEAIPPAYSEHLGRQVMAYIANTALTSAAMNANQEPQRFPASGAAPCYVAALFVQPDGCYAGWPWIDAWDKERDARKYQGPFPVVAHPPCQLWGAMANVNFARWGGEHNRPGNDGGCFAAALAAVNRWGGVLEHPAKTRAWAAHGLEKPTGTGWQRSGLGWVCEVWQSAYGHRANKATWLYYHGPRKPLELRWARPVGTHQIGFRDQRGPEKNKPTLGKREANATPLAFRDELLRLVLHSAT